MGNGDLTLNEQRSHFALWALLKSPLMVGTDLAKLLPEAYSILLAAEVLAVNQDPLGVAGDLVWKEGPAEVRAQFAQSTCLCVDKSLKAMRWSDPSLVEFLTTSSIFRPFVLSRRFACGTVLLMSNIEADDVLQVYAGPLKGGSRAVVLFNRHVIGTQYPFSNITVSWKTLGYDSDAEATVRDLFAEKDLGTFRGSLTLQVDIHDARMVKIEPLHKADADEDWRPWHVNEAFVAEVRSKMLQHRASIPLLPLAVHAS